MLPPRSRSGYYVLQRHGACMVRRKRLFRRPERTLAQRHKGLAAGRKGLFGSMKGPLVPRPNACCCGMRGSLPRCDGFTGTSAPVVFDFVLSKFRQDRLYIYAKSYGSDSAVAEGKPSSLRRHTARLHLYSGLPAGILACHGIKKRLFCKKQELTVIRLPALHIVSKTAYPQTIFCNPCRSDLHREWCTNAKKNRKNLWMLIIYI